MSVTRVAGGHIARQVAKVAVAVAAILLLAGVVDVALAQGTPFGAPRPPQGAPPAPPIGGIAGWILAKQAEFYRGLSGLVRAAKADGSAVWALLGLSFVYGVFHAAGPGHGKAVISSYVIANEETWWRGVVLSFASAILQAAVAVAFVGVAAALLKKTASEMNLAVRWIEIVSYSLIIFIGLRLLWVKGRALFNAWRTLRADKAGAAHHHHDHGHHHHDDGAHHHHAHHDHAHHDHAHHDHAHHDHDHDDASAWGHAHAPEPAELAGPGGWKRGLSAIVAVGLRPCTGAILVLVFALSQELFWAGVLSAFVMGIGTAITVAMIATIAVGAKAWAKRFAGSGIGYGMLAMRGIEVAASLVIIAFGALLLAGYMVSERMIGV